MKLLRDPAIWFTLLAAVGLSLATSGHVFFWDTIQLASRQADWFYRNDFCCLLLPDEIDSGHPPGFGAYLAGCWKLFGRTLFVSHLAMIPWLWLLGYQLVRLCRAASDDHRWPLLLALVLAEPVLLGQVLLISPDVVLLGALLLGLNAVLSHRRGQVLIAVGLLAVISLRGMLLGLGLYGIDLFRLWQNDRRLLLFFSDGPRRLLPYLPGGLLGLSFLLYHYTVKGWIGYHPDSPWAPSFARVDAMGLARNVVVFGWRLLDYGRVFVWLALCIGLWLERERLSIRLPRGPAQWLLVGSILFALLLAFPLLTHRGLLNHRYLLPVVVLFDMLAGYLLLHKIWRGRRLLYLLSLAGLLSGNLWVYPPPIAQGWDSTPAHLPYYRVRGEMLRELERREIPPDSVGTAFPEIGPLDYRDLSGRREGLVDKDLPHQRYIFYSNVMNDFTEAELDILRRDYVPVFQSNHWPITGVLYQRRTASF